MSSSQHSVLNRTLGQIRTNIYNPISTDNTDHIVGAILQSSENVANTNGQLLTSLIEKLNSTQNDIMTKLINLDNSFNQANQVTMQTISNNETSVKQQLLENLNKNDNYNIYILEKLAELSYSFNLSLSNKTTRFFEKLIDTENSFNLALLEHDLSLNLTLSNNMETLVNKLIISDYSCNKAISDNVTSVITKLLETEEKFNNALIQNDISNNNNNTAICNIIDTLVAYDISFNNNLSQNTTSILNKIVNYDISFNNYTQYIIDKLATIDISLNLAIQNVKPADGVVTEGFIIGQNQLWQKLDTILNTLIANESSVTDNLTNLFEQLNMNTLDSQKTLTKYVGQYIVLPLYEQRLNDIYIIHIKLLEKQVLDDLEKYLKYFRAGDFASLQLYFTFDEQEKLSSTIYEIKNDAFKSFLNTTPGATCFTDMTEDAINQYKSFKRYVSWGYKSLDGIIKGVRLYEEYTNLEVLNELYKLDNEILNDNEKLEAYLEEVRIEAKKQFTLFDTKVEVDLVSQINIKPQYLEYFKRHGVPDNWQFDSEKLAIIIKDLTSAGVIADPNVSESCTTDTDDNAISSSDVENVTSSNEISVSTGETPCTDKTTSESEIPCDTSSDIDSKNTSSDSDDNTLKATLKACDYTSSDSESIPGVNTDLDTDSISEREGYTSSSDDNKSIKNKICNSISSSCPSVSVDSCSVNDDDLNGIELGVNCITSYYVYIYSDDSVYDQYTYYYPLYLSEKDARDSVDVDHSKYNANFDISGNVYSTNDATDPSGVTSWTFPQFPNIIFWQPNSHAYRSVGTPYHPPLALEWVMFTKYIGSSGLYGCIDDKNSQFPRSAHTFELGNIAYFNYLKTAPTVKKTFFNVEAELKIDISFNSIINIDMFKDALQTNIATDLNVSKNSVIILDILSGSIIIIFSVETDTPTKQTFISNIVSNSLPTSLTSYTYSTDILDASAISYLSTVTSFEITNVQTTNRETSNTDPIKYDLVVDIPWIASPDASQNNWRNIFSYSNDTDLFVHNAFSDFFIFNNKYYTDKNNWFGENILSVNTTTSDGEYENIALDYLKHIANDVFKNEQGFLLIENRQELYNNIINNSIDDEIIDKLIESNTSGITGSQSSNIFPYQIFNQLLYNSQIGRDRLNRLLQNRENINSHMYLLETGDKLVFNLTINPSVDYTPENPPQLLGEDLTPKTYKIILTLM
tara:strand:+ start:544 stop:4143 length:3600 start_codon:yes stop_codon:yes gene_type:complete